MTSSPTLEQQHRVTYSHGTLHCVRCPESVSMPAPVDHAEWLRWVHNHACNLDWYSDSDRVWSAEL